MVGSVVAAGLRARVGDDGQVESFGGLFDVGLEVGALGAVDVGFERDADG